MIAAAIGLTPYTSSWRHLRWRRESAVVDGWQVQILHIALVPNSAAVIPRYRKPPVFEMGMLVRFEPLPIDFPAARMALFWDRVRADFPLFQAAQPTEVPIESFDGARTSGIAFEFGLVGPPPQRLFFVSENQEHLIQIQSDHFGCNWRKLAADASYPHYKESLRSRFVEKMTAFLKFLADEGLKQTPVPKQCEMIYVNHIAAGGPWKTHADFPAIFSCVPAPPLPLELNTEEVNYLLRSQFTDPKARIRGRLHVAIEPRLRAGDGAPLYVMTLTARGAPASPDVDGVMAFFDVAREHIVRTFTDLTTPEMHQHWERIP